MKKIILVILITFVGLSFTAAEEGSWEWKGNVASTTYGVALMPVTIENYTTGFEETIFVPGLDIRLFNGKNVGKRGGFYTGVETGAIIFFAPDETFTDSYLGTSYDFAPEAFLATVFVLAKYGYRLDLGVKLFGISLGWEMGIGAKIASGMFELKTEINGHEGSADVGYEASPMSMALDTAAEASVRIGPNFRFVTKVGAMLSVPLVMMDSDSETSIGDPATVGGEGDADSIMGSYDAESFPVVPNARVGFIVSY